MDSQLLNSRDAATALGVSVLTLYDWLSQSDAGEFEIRGQSVTINYYQGGRKGQGRIQIEAAEVDRLKELMRVRPRPVPQRHPPQRRHFYPGITVELGDPGDSLSM